MRNKKLQGQTLFDVNERKNNALKAKENGNRSPKKISPRGKRKLSFVAKKPNLLSGKKFFLDLQAYGKSSFVKDVIEQLGGTLEEFNSKEVYCIITNRFTVEEISASKAQNDKRGTPSPLPWAIPSPLVPVPSPLQPISSNKFAVNSPLSTDSPQTPQSVDPKGLSILRGKTLQQLKAVSSTQKLGSSNLLQLAKKWGTKVLHIDKFLKWTKEKKTTLCLQATNARSRKTEASLTDLKSSTTKVKSLTTPFIKIEDQSRKYRPFFSQLDEWPCIHYESVSGSCPFEKPKERQIHTETIEQVSDKETNKDDSSQAMSEKASEKKPEKKENAKCGYCECCSVRFEDMSKHLKSDQHRKFAKNDKNYAELDSVINCGRTFDDFLAEITKNYQIVAEKNTTYRHNVTRYSNGEDSTAAKYVENQETIKVDLSENSKVIDKEIQPRDVEGVVVAGDQERNIVDLKIPDVTELKPDDFEGIEMNEAEKTEIVCIDKEKLAGEIGQFEGEKNLDLNLDAINLDVDRRDTDSKLHVEKCDWDHRNSTAIKTDYCDASNSQYEGNTVSVRGERFMNIETQITLANYEGISEMRILESECARSESKDPSYFLPDVFNHSWSGSLVCILKRSLCIQPTLKMLNESKSPLIFSPALEMMENNGSKSGSLNKLSKGDRGKDIKENEMAHCETYLNSLNEALRIDFPKMDSVCDDELRDLIDEEFDAVVENEKKICVKSQADVKDIVMDVFVDEVKKSEKSELPNDGKRADNDMEELRQTTLRKSLSPKIKSVRSSGGKFQPSSGVENLKKIDKNVVVSDEHDSKKGGNTVLCSIAHAHGKKELLNRDHVQDNYWGSSTSDIETFNGIYSASSNDAMFGDDSTREELSSPNKGEKKMNNDDKKEECNQTLTNQIIANKDVVEAVAPNEHGVQNDFVIPLGTAIPREKEAGTPKASATSFFFVKSPVESGDTSLIEGAIEHHESLPAEAVTKAISQKNNIALECSPVCSPKFYTNLFGNKQCSVPGHLADESINHAISFINSPIEREKWQPGESPEKIIDFSSPATDHILRNQVDDILCGLTLSTDKTHKIPGIVNTGHSTKKKCQKSLDLATVEEGSHIAKGACLDDADCERKKPKTGRKRLHTTLSPQQTLLREAKRSCTDDEMLLNVDVDVTTISGNNEIIATKNVKDLLDFSLSNYQSTFSIVDDENVFIGEDLKFGITMHERLKTRKRMASSKAAFQIASPKKSSCKKANSKSKSCSEPLENSFKKAEAAMKTQKNNSDALASNSTSRRRTRSSSTPLDEKDSALCYETPTKQVRFRSVNSADDLKLNGNNALCPIEICSTPTPQATPKISHSNNEDFILKLTSSARSSSTGGNESFNTSTSNSVALSVSNALHSGRKTRVRTAAGKNGKEKTKIRSKRLSSSTKYSFNKMKEIFEYDDDPYVFNGP